MDQGSASDGGERQPRRSVSFSRDARSRPSSQCICAGQNKNR